MQGSPGVNRWGVAPWTRVNEYRFMASIARFTGMSIAGQSHRFVEDGVS